MDKRKEINKIVRESLRESLLYFMRRKPFQEITVTELINKAGVARATYYRNFDSKEDLARSYLKIIAEDFDSDEFIANSKDSNERVHRSFQYIDKYKEDLILYYDAGLSELILDSLSDITYYQIDKAQYPFMDDMYIAAFIGALYNVVRKWLLDGAKKSSDEMADIFTNIWHNRKFSK